MGDHADEDEGVIDGIIPYRIINNFKVPAQRFFTKKNVESSLTYQHRDGDIIVATYPKTGSNWLQYIVWQILYKGESYPSFVELTQHLVPFMEMTGTEVIDKLLPPRFYKNHFPYNMMSINEKAKYIYIHRDPKDTVVSFFHFQNNFVPVPLEFEPFFEAFMEGNIPYGDYFDHVLSFYPHRNDDNLLFLSYEELLKDTRSQILRIAKFLGEEYYDNLKENEELLAHILKVTSFDYMKKNLPIIRPQMKKADTPNSESSKPEEGETKVNFFRKGVIGDGKASLSAEQLERIRQKTLEKMKGTELAELWTA